MRVSGRFRSGDIRHNCADVGRLRQSVGFVPQISFEDGISGFCSWAAGELAAAPVATRGYTEALRELEARGLMMESGSSG